MTKRNAAVDADLKKINEKAAKKRAELELLLDCRKLEFLTCPPDSWAHGALLEEIDSVEKKLKRLGSIPGRRTAR